MRVKIDDVDHKGNGIARLNNKIIFIPKCIVGDDVEMKIVKSHKKYDEGRVKEIVNGSFDRIDSLCPYYQVCNGCNISNMNYSKQLEYKKDKVVNIFKRYLGMNIDPLIIGSDKRYEYRNKITYHCVNGRLGLISVDNELIDVDKCMLVSEKVNELYRKICCEDLVNVEKLVIKECDNGLLLLIDGNMNIDRVKDMCLSIYMNNCCVYKKDDGYINVGDIKYRISKDSFFQINTNNIFRLYDLIVEYGEFNKTDNVIDLYCGVGSISLYISKYVNSVFGIEIIEDAIKDAGENAKINNIKNVNFICGDVSRLFDNSINGNKIIVDPPRGGLDNHTVEILNNILIEKLIYVSCDPMTLVRDLKKLDKYNINEITIVDMFPQTHHCEVVVKLAKK